MKMCSSSVVPIPSRIGLPVLRRQSSKTGGGKVSPAETAIRSEDKSAPCSIAPSIARYAVGAVKQIVALYVSMIWIMLAGDAFSSSVAVAPNRKGKIASPPRPHVKASGGEQRK